MSKTIDKAQEIELNCLLVEIAAQYAYFKKVDPRGSYTKILKNIIGKRKINYLPEQEYFYLLWPLYVTGKHDESYLKRRTFSAHDAFLKYQQNPKENHQKLNEEFFKQIFKTLKEEIAPKRETILEKPANNTINLDAEIDKLECKKLPFFMRFSDTQMGMILKPQRLQAFQNQP